MSNTSVDKNNQNHNNQLNANSMQEMMRVEQNLSSQRQAESMN